MDSDPTDSDETPALGDVLRALDDAECRRILSEITEPMTAKELTTRCDIPQSTVYRKLDLLSRASLVREFDQVGPEGGRITRYERDVTDVTISVSDEAFAVSIDRPGRGPDERLARMWSEIGEEL